MSYFGKNKLPVLRLFLYPTVAFITYCAYEDWNFRSHKSILHPKDPIFLLEQSHLKWKNCQSVQGLLPIYKFSYNHISKYMTHPLYRKNLVKDFKADKNGSFVSIQTELYINHYLRQRQRESGDFNIGLWANWQKQNRLLAQPAQVQISIIKQQLKDRNKRCLQICQTESAKKSRNFNENQVINCIRKTQTIATLIEREVQKYDIMQKQWI